ncbi:Hypp7939 [Branchiostoma lanceolatum]|uniref:Hypp7939 protein n=1 Tax=Branchiostoma lanceolatum TaxID=7740 RepID=A0A8K0EGF8_BRALA|nr:Hypp7939 [Branchiostoma lanceolatum]
MTTLKVAMMLLLLQCIAGRVDNSETGESTYGTNGVENSQISKEDHESNNIHDALQQMGIYIHDARNQKNFDEAVKDNKEASQGAASEAEDIYDILRAKGLKIDDDDTDADQNTRKQEERGVIIKGQNDDSAAKKPINVINNEIYIPRRLWNKYVKEGKIHIINNMINIYLPQPIDVPGGKDEYHANLPSGPMTIRVGPEPATLGDTRMEKGRSILPSVVLGRIERRDTASASNDDNDTAERNVRSKKDVISEHQHEQEDV